MEDLRAPNRFYYDEAGGIEHDFMKEGSNPTLSEYGARGKFHCLDNWILGEGFAFDVHFFCSHSYNYWVRVFEFRLGKTDKWHELQVHLLKYKNIHLTDLTRNQMGKLLGLKQIRNKRKTANEQNRMDGQDLESCNGLPQGQ